MSTSLKNKIIKFSVNAGFIDKSPHFAHSFSYPFISVEDSLENLAQEIKNGWSFSYQFRDQKRKKENFIASDILVIDIDDNWSISDALKAPINSNYCSLLYTTSGHSPDHHRFRLIFILPRTISDPEELRAATRSLAKRLNGDLSATDPARMFYGNTQATFHFFDKEISNEFLDELIQEGKTIPISDSISSFTPATTRSSYYLKPETEFRTSDNKIIKFAEFEAKTSIYCPFHHDQNPSAFLAFNKSKKRFMRCSTCSTTYWINDEASLFDFSSLEKIASRYKLNPPKRDSSLKTSLEALFEDEIQLISDQINFSNDRFLALNQIESGLTFVKSPKGTGKTSFLKKALEKILYTFQSASLEIYEENNDPQSESPFYSNKKVLLIGHRQALIREMCQNLGLNCYLDTTESHSLRRYGVCLDSMGLVFNKGKAPQYDVVIIDESEQVLSHFLSETIGNKRLEIFTQFEAILKQAKSVVALDADLDWITFNTITKLANPDHLKPSRIYFNTVQLSKDSIYVYKAASQLIDHIRESIVAGKKIFISSNSKSKVKALEKSVEELEKLTGLSIPMIAITSENSKSNEVQKFIGNIKEEIKNYQVVLSSPSLGTGIDITFENNAQEIDVVYGLYENRINSHTEIDQQLARVRNPKEVHVWVSPRSFNFETEFEVIKDELLENNFLLNIYDKNQISLNQNNDASPSISNFLLMATLITSYQRASKNQLKNNFINYKVEQGWKIHEVPEDEALMTTGNAFLSIGNKKLQKEVIDNIVNARALPIELYDDVLDRMDSNEEGVTQDEFYSYLRTKIELFYRMPITAKLVEMDNKGKLRKGITNHEIILDKELIKFYANEKLDTNTTKIERNLMERILPNRISSILLLYRILSNTPYFVNGKFDHKVTFNSDDLGNFSNEMLKLKPYIENHLKINIRKDIKNKPVQQLNEILKLVGLKHWNGKAKVINGTKIYNYKLSTDQLNFVNVVLKNRKAQNRWDYVNKLHGFKFNEDYEPRRFSRR